MSEHIIHWLPVFILIIGTLFFKYRSRVKFSFLISLLLLNLTFNNLFLHLDHQFFSAVSENIHQCCILPFGLETKVVVVEVDALVLEKFVPLIGVVNSEKTITYYYSRPPPLS